MEWEAFRQLLEGSGLAVTILVAAGLGFWRFAKWVAAKVVEPIVTSHTAHVQAISESNAKKDEILEKHSDLLVRLEDGQERLCENTHCIAEGQKEIATSQKGIAELLKRTAGS